MMTEIRRSLGIALCSLLLLWGNQAEATTIGVPEANELIDSVDTIVVVKLKSEAANDSVAAEVTEVLKGDPALKGSVVTAKSQFSSIEFPLPNFVKDAGASEVILVGQWQADKRAVTLIYGGASFWPIGAPADVSPHRTVQKCREKVQERLKVRKSDAVPPSAQSQPQSPASSAAQDEDGKRLVAAVTQKVSVGDIRGVIDVLPDLEALRKQDSQSYLVAVNIGVRALIGSKNPEAAKAAISVFPNMIDTKCPADTVSATAYIRFKDSIIGCYWNLDEVRGNKERLLMVATFLGEVRSLRIPGYQNRGTNLPGLEILMKAGVNEVEDLPTAAEREAVAEAIRKNEEDLKMNRLQTALFSADSGITFTLVIYAREFSVKDPESRQFYQELAKRARLTEDEIKKLNTPK